MNFFAKIAKFFENLFESFLGLFNSGGPKVDPHASNRLAKGNFQRDHTAATAFRPRLQPIGEATPRIEFLAEDKERIKVSTYGEEDLKKWEAYRAANGYDIRDEMAQTEHEKHMRISEAWFKKDERLSQDSRKAWALGAINEYNGKMAELDNKMAELKPRTKNFNEVIGLIKSVKLANAGKKSGYSQKPVVGFSDDNRHLLVALPASVSEVEINISKMQKGALSVDVIPKDGTAIHIDNLTLAELNNMVVVRPGAETKLAVHAAGVSGAALAIWDHKNTPVDPSDQRLITLGQGVAVNGLRNTGFGSSTEYADNGYKPTATPTIKTAGQQSGLISPS